GELADHYSVARARVNELIAAQVDPDVRSAGCVRLKEHEIPGLEVAAAHTGAAEKLRVGGARQVDPEHREDVLHVARAIEARRRRPAERVGYAKKAHRVVGEVRGNRGGAIDDPAGQAVQRRGIVRG